MVTRLDHSQLKAQVIALLTIPAAIAGQFINNIKYIMVASIILGMLFTTLGLGISYYFNITSGATIILVSGTTYLIGLGVKTLQT